MQDTKDIELNEEKVNIFNSIISYDKGKFLIDGAAGTGKSLLAKKLIRFYLENDKTVCYLTPTHEAKKQIIQEFEGVKDIDFKTVASFINTKKTINPITGEKQFVEDNDNKKTSYNVVIIDECYMLTKSQITKIYSKCVDNILICIGDIYQLPPTSGVCGVPMVNFHKKYVISEVKRNNSSILDLCTKLRTDIHLPEDETEDIQISNIRDDFISSFIAKVKQSNPGEVAYLAFTNKDVEKTRDALHLGLYNTSLPVVGQKIKIKEVQSGLKIKSGDYFEITNIETSQVILFSKVFELYNLTIESEEYLPLSIRCLSYHDQDIISNTLKQYYEECANLNLLFKKNKNMNTYNNWLFKRKQVLATHNISFITCPYTMTVHNSQSKTINDVFLNMRNIMSYRNNPHMRNLLYVGASRAKNKLITLI